MKSAQLIFPARTSSLICQTLVPDPIGWPRKLPLSMAPPGNHERRQIATRRAHHERGRGLVAATQQNDSINRIAPNRFLHVHAHQVAEEHGGRPHVGFAQRHDGKLQRKASGLVNAALDPVRHQPEMCVARGQFRPRIANADNRPAIEQIGRKSLVLHPRTMNETISILKAKPVSGAERSAIFSCHICILGNWTSGNDSPAFYNSWRHHRRAPLLLVPLA